MTDKPIDIERIRLKRGRPSLPPEYVMHQMSLRLPPWMIERIDLIIEHERYGQGDRATIIREALAAYLDKP